MGNTSGWWPGLDGYVGRKIVGEKMVSRGCGFSPLQVLAS